MLGLRWSAAEAAVSILITDAAGVAGKNRAANAPRTNLETVRGPGWSHSPKATLSDPETAEQRSIAGR